ncbi:hypothetical protein L1049_027551 [Liquidambar formosana]|uniref:FHA domain-containing protein n=1 Tax=Liquidambar formosana TaxID=63359 RepID=A0AAP0RHL7_LIQFO
MVSTRRSGSLSGNNSKRSSSSEEKPPSPKRQKVENGGATEKSTPSAENSKDVCSPAALDPGECDSVDPPIADVGDAVNSEKVEAVEIPLVTPLAEVSSPLFVDKARSSISSWSASQKQNPSFETSTPWCKLLSQYAQNLSVAICTSNFSIGSNRHCNLLLKDPTVSGVLCRIKHTQHEGSTVAVLESTGSKGSVLVNGTVVKKNTSCVLNSGDEVVFSLLGNYAYIFQQLLTEVGVKVPPPIGAAELPSSVGKFMHLERRSGDPSAVAGASILASLSNLRQDLSRWKPATSSTG